MRKLICLLNKQLDNIHVDGKRKIFCDMLEFQLPNLLILFKIKLNLYLEHNTIYTS